MKNSNIYIMKYVIFNLLAPNATGDNHQIRLESTQCENIQYTFKASDSPACMYLIRII